MGPDLFLAVLVRVTAALVWVDLAADIIRNGQPASPLARRLTVLLVAVGLSLLAVGGLVPLGIPADLMRLVYTVFSGFALVLGLALRRSWRADEVADALEDG